MKRHTTFLLGMLGAVGCSPGARTPMNTAPVEPPVVSQRLAPTATAEPEAAAPAPTCTPSDHEPETIALHRLVEEATTWKSTVPFKGEEKQIRLLGFNDFHGQLVPPPPIEGRPIGGAAVLAAYFRAAERKGATLAVHAGDMIGASPPASALNQDEPTIKFMGQILGPGCTRETRDSDSCHVMASLGNHEFDEGVPEFRRILNGGNHPHGPFLGHDYPGAAFAYLGANVHERATGKPLVEPYSVKLVSGVRLGFIGAVLKESPVFIMPSGIKDVSFDDEVEAINAAADTLSKQGVHALVVVIHQGAHQCFAAGVTHDEHAVSGPLVAIVKKLHPDIDVVVSGHTHSVLSALIPNSAGTPTLVTQAFHAGTGFAQIDLALDAATGDVLQKQARIVTPWADIEPGRSPVPEIAALVNEAQDSVLARTTKVIGTAAATLHAALDAAGNSEMGNFIADAQRESTNADIALTTPSWVRGDINQGTVTWGELFRVQPFGNRLVKVVLTGEQIIQLLDAQWTPNDHPRVLHVSGLSYRWDPSAGPKRRVSAVRHNGKPLGPAKRYTVALNEYLAEGGDGFKLLESVARTPTSLLDVDALSQYVKRHNPLRPNPEKRIEVETTGKP